MDKGLMEGHETDSRRRTSAGVAAAFVVALGASCGGLVDEGASTPTDDGGVDGDGSPLGDPDSTGSQDAAAAPDVSAPPDTAVEASGDADSTTRCSPTAAGAQVKQLSCGATHACVLMSDGTVKCWGGNDYGELGDGTMNAHLTPTQVPCLSDVAQLSAGARHTCAVKTDGSVLCWGDNASWQLGIGIVSTQLVPKTVVGLSGFVQVAAGNNHTCAVRADGTVACWGDDLNGPIGAPYDGHSVPPTIPGITTAAQVVVGAQHTCVRLAQGTITCWGADDKDQRGDFPAHGVGDTQSSTAGVAGAVDLSANEGDHNCARVAGDTLCWGASDDGQIGDGTTAYWKAPTSVLDGAHVVQISASSDFTCGVWQGGSVRCWGYGIYGALGDGYTDHAAPAVVPGVTGASSVAAGWSFTCALLGDHSVWCWGDNGVGQLGDGTTTRRFTAAPVHF